MTSALTKPDSEPRFLEALFMRILRDVQRVQFGNIDPLRFPDDLISPIGKVRDYLANWARDIRARLFPRSNARSLNDEAAQLAEVVANAGNIARLYDLLFEQLSRDLLLEVLAFRVLGRRRVRLTQDSAKTDRWSEKQAARMVVASKTDSVSAPLRWLNLYDLSPVGFDIRLHVHPLNVICTFIREQYFCRRPQMADITAPTGGIVIDGGGCWGDTALYFACKVGAAGRVVTFEFDPANLKILSRNLALNPGLQDRVKVVARPLWDEAGKLVATSGNGPATSVHSGAEEGFETVTVDEMVVTEKLPRVDMIKLDVEGAELAALRGAAATLRQFRPNLAIALYHRLRDFWEITDYIHGLGLGYRFHLDHFTSHLEETILFASANH